MRRMPWHPLKYVETMDLYFYCPAVSQMYSLAGFPFSVIFFILKSTVVTRVLFSEWNSPYTNRQKSAVFPTLLSPTRMNLYFFYSPKDKYLSSIAILVILTQIINSIRQIKVNYLSRI